MQAREIMTQKVLTVREKAHFSEAAHLLVRHRVSGLPVVDAEERLVGIITPSDLMLRHWAVNLVEDLMTRPVITIEGSMHLSEIAKLLIDHNIKRVVVVDGERVIGIVSRADVIRAEFAEEADAIT